MPGRAAFTKARKERAETATPLARNVAQALSAGRPGAAATATDMWPGLCHHPERS